MNEWWRQFSLSRLFNCLWNIAQNHVIGTNLCCCFELLRLHYKSGDGRVDVTTVSHGQWYAMLRPDWNQLWPGFESPIHDGDLNEVAGPWAQRPWSSRTLTLSHAVKITDCYGVTRTFVKYVHEHQIYSVVMSINIKKSSCMRIGSKFNVNAPSLSRHRWK